MVDLSVRRRAAQCRDNLSTHCRRPPCGGPIVDGSIRDLRASPRMDMPAYYKNTTHPYWKVTSQGIISDPDRKRYCSSGRPGTPIAKVLLYSSPCYGGRRQRRRAHVHDEGPAGSSHGWYKSSEIYGSPRDLCWKSTKSKTKRRDEIKKEALVGQADGSISRLIRRAAFAFSRFVAPRQPTAPQTQRPYAAAGHRRLPPRAHVVGVPEAGAPQAFNPSRAG
jgi:hypothetical protein